MRKKSAISLTSYEDLFKEEQDASAKEGERIQQVSLDSLQEFPNHPWIARNNADLFETNSGVVMTVAGTIEKGTQVD